MTPLGSALRASREALGLSQAKLSEATGIPQYILSAFELGKSLLSDEQAAIVKAALSDKNVLLTLVDRKKRYRNREYTEIHHDPSRRARYVQTEGNIEYCDLLRRLSSSKPRNGYSAISLFSGCGGFSLGFSWAGFEIRGHLEIDDGLRSIYKRNFDDVLELGADITAISDDEIAEGRTKLGDIDVIIGGPPCQGFSLSGKRNVADPRNTLFRHYLRFVDAYKPKFAVMENVRLLTSMKSSSGGFVKDEIGREFEQHGYLVKEFEINARDYGVPQHRERVIFVAVRKDMGVSPSFPERTHGTRPGLFDQIRPYRTFADACSDLPYLESGESSDDPLHSTVAHPRHVIDWLWDVREGCSAHDNEDPEKRPPSGYNTTYKRQVWFEPGSTVQTTFGMISGCRNVHPIATRSLTAREAARLQSFPDTFDFGDGNLGTIRTGIGNAVPPLLGCAIGAYVRSKLV